MTDQSTFDYLLSFFRDIYSLGDNIPIYSSAGLTVSLNQFFLGIVIMGIVIFALINFAKSLGSPSVQTGFEKRTRDKRLRRERKERIEKRNSKP